MVANTTFLAPEEKERRNWSESSRFVEGMIQESKLREQDSSGTAQGYYAFSAAGNFYGANNSERDEILELLKGARKAFKDNPPKKTSLNEKTLGPESKIPEGTTVLNVFSRIDPAPKELAGDDLNRGVGRDHLWILKKDTEEILSRLKDVKTAEAPNALVLRLVRFHLVDNVRGEPDHWDPENIKSTSFKIEKLTENENSIGVKLSGNYSMLMPARKRDEKPHHVPEMGLIGNLEALFSIDKNTHALVDAKIFASGEGWGESTFTMGAPKGKYPLKFAMVLAHDAYATQIAPQGVMSDRDDYLGEEK